MENSNSYANVCRLCLKGDLQIYSIRNTYLQDVYEKITSIELNSTYIQSLCYICVKRLKQCHKLIEQAVETDKLLKDALRCGVKIDKIKCVQTFTLSVSSISTINISLHPVENDIKEESSKIKEELKDDWDSGINAISDQIEEDQIDQKISTGSKETYSIDGLRAYEDVKDISDSDDDVPLNNISLKIHSETKQDSVKNKKFSAFNPLKLTNKEKANEVVKFSKEDVPEKPNLILENKPKESNEIILKTNALNKSDKDSNNLNKIPKNSKKVKSMSLRKKLNKDSFLTNSNDNLTEPHVTNNPKIHNRNETLTLNETKSANNIYLELPKTSKIHLNDKPNDKKHDSIFLFPNKYICNICNYETASKKYLIFHLRMHDSKEKIHCCSQCQYMTNVKRDFNTHLRKHTGEKLYECHICQRKFSHIASLNRHRRIHTGEKPYKCHVCQRKFNDIANLNKHRIIHKDEKPYECHICQRKFNYICNFNRHRRIHKDEKPYECHICQRKFNDISNLNKHVRIHTGEKPYECHICQRKFNDITNLNKHIRIHTGEKPYVCHICQRKFSRSADLNKHVRIHTGEKPYLCHICQRKFSQIAFLNRHRRIHTGEKPYECHICQRKFSRSADLNKHVRIHTGEKPYECLLCPKKYTRKNSLNCHYLRAHHTEINQTVA